MSCNDRELKTSYWRDKLTIALKRLLICGQNLTETEA